MKIYKNSVPVRSTAPNFTLSLSFSIEGVISITLVNSRIAKNSPIILESIKKIRSKKECVSLSKKLFREIDELVTI